MERVADGQPPGEALCPQVRAVDRQIPDVHRNQGEGQIPAALREQPNRLPLDTCRMKRVWDAWGAVRR